MRALGVDLGEKRVGLAISDPLGMIAHQLETLSVSGEKDALESVRALAKEKEVELIVVGLPMNMDGSEGPQARAARKFAGMLKEAAAMPVELQDERLTTVRAERAMLDADMSRAMRGKRRDRMAAQFILQAYLDRHSA